MKGISMYTVRRLYDVPGPNLGDGFTLGTAETVDELHEILREPRGVFTITGAAATVRLTVEAAVGTDRAFVEQITDAADGRVNIEELVSQ